MVIVGLILGNGGWPADGFSHCSYRYQLEAFVDKVRGRTPQSWTAAQEPVYQLKVVEQIYQKVRSVVRTVLWQVG